MILKQWPFVVFIRMFKKALDPTLFSKHFSLSLSKAKYGVPLKINIEINLINHGRRRWDKSWRILYITSRTDNIRKRFLFFRNKTQSRFLFKMASSPDILNRTGLKIWILGPLQLQIVSFWSYFVIANHLC